MATETNKIDASSLVEIQNAPLVSILNPVRTADMLRRQSYFECTQHDHKRFTWEGHYVRFGADSYVPATTYVPMSQRQPSARLDLAKIITDRLTSMLFGKEHWPMVEVKGDKIAEDYCGALIDESDISMKLIEARNNGGATGTSVLSWGFVEGKPVVEVHDAAHIEVLDWANYEKRKPRKVLKAYPFKKMVFNGEKFVEERFFYARYIDESVDVIWSDIPEEIAKIKSWKRVPAEVVDHNIGFCPVYWIQNIPVSNRADGKSDFENQEKDFDTLDCLKSATSKGAVLNVDPTVVIKDDRTANEGVVHKGSEHAIYSKGGAAYLELSGTAIEAARKLLRDGKQHELDKASVVVQDPEQLSGSGISAAAMKLRFANMLVKCDILREQYGKAIVNILKDMLAVSRTLRTPRDDSGQWSKVDLPPKVEENEDGTVLIRERVPGDGDQLVLHWSPYFSATWQDKKDAITTVSEATGKKQVLSQKTAVTAISQLFGIENVEAELKQIEEDNERNAERARSLFDAGAPNIPFGSKEEDEDIDDGGSHEPSEEEM